MEDIYGDVYKWDFVLVDQDKRQEKSGLYIKVKCIVGVIISGIQREMGMWYGEVMQIWELVFYFEKFMFSVM